MNKLFFIIFVYASFCLEAVIPQKVVLCGICKDVEKQLPKTMQIMESVGALFEDYRIVVYENNSKDATQSILRKWSRKNFRVFVNSEMIHKELLELQTINHLREGPLLRTEAIARARNKVLDIVMSDQYENFPYLIWMDMDFTRRPALEGIVEAFQTDQEWDAVFAYGVGPGGNYWDWYAFRDFGYSPIGSELLGDAWWNIPDYHCFSLSSNSNWYPVTSAFGGCGIYKKSSIVGCRYTAYVTEDLEEVAKKVIDQGKRSGHFRILNYLEGLKNLRQVIYIDKPIPGLPRMYDEDIGFVLNKHPDPLIWRFSSSACQYPSVCEHVSFHASMIVRGHDKLFINPRMVFVYGDQFD